MGEFSQAGDSVAGTFLTETGDHRFLAGQVRGAEMYLSTFDGAHAFLYKARQARGMVRCPVISGRAPPLTTLDRETRCPRGFAGRLFANQHARRRRTFAFAFPDL